MFVYKTRNKLDPSTNICRKPLYRISHSEVSTLVIPLFPASQPRENPCHRICICLLYIQVL